VHLNELIVQSRVGDRCEMKNRVESGSCRIAELFSPIERRQVFGDDISAIPCKVLEITGPEIIITVRCASGNFSCNISVRFDPMNPAPPVMMNLGLDAVVVFVIEKL